MSHQAKEDCKIIIWGDWTQLYLDKPYPYSFPFDPKMNVEE